MAKNPFNPNAPDDYKTSWLDIVLSVLVFFFLVGGILAFGTYVKANAADVPTVNVCTGGKDNPYDRSALYFGQFTKQLNIVSVNTDGSWEALNKTVAGECDAYIGQPDATALMARTNKAKAQKVTKIASLFREYAHVLCSVKSGVDDLGDLSGETKYSIDLGKEGSGGWLLWQNFVAEDDSYKGVQLRGKGGIKALTAVSTDQTTCALFTGGIHNKLADTANDSFEGLVALVGANDKDFNDAKDTDDTPLYEFVDMPDAYDHLQGFWDVTTVSWLAGVYVNPDAEVFQNEDNYDNFLLAVTRARPGIIAEFGQ